MIHRGFRWSGGRRGTQRSDFHSTPEEDPFVDEPFFRIFHLNHEGLHAGTHMLRYVINDEFFSLLPFSPVQHGEVHVQVEAHKQKGSLVLRIQMKGWVEVSCDRCLGKFPYSVDIQRRLVIKITDKVQGIERDQDLMLIPPHVHTIPLARDFYDFLLISLPMKITHPEGACDPSILEILEQHEHSGSSTNEDPADAPADPRWEQLNQFLEEPKTVRE